MNVYVVETDEPNSVAMFFASRLNAEGHLGFVRSRFEERGLPIGILKLTQINITTREETVLTEGNHMGPDDDEDDEDDESD